MQSLGMATPASATSASSMPKASLFSSAGGRNFNNSNARMSSRFETPGLTPIPANASILAQSPSDVGGHQDPRVVRRAQQVAARLYYEPSPETPHTAEIRTSLQYLRGLGRQADPAATPNAGETPLRRGGRAKEGNDNAIPSTMSASSFARKPRALFSSSENNINNTAEPEGMDDSSHEEASPQIEKDTSVQTHGDKQKGIKDILGLLSLMGSAWRRVCQVRHLHLIDKASVVFQFFWAHLLNISLNHSLVSLPRSSPNI